MAFGTTRSTSGFRRNWLISRSASGIGCTSAWSGPYVSVKLNDKQVVDNVVMENYYNPKRTTPIFARGPIYLQTHGAETRFRNVFVREIPADEANKELAQIEGGEDGFQSVFNGRDFSGWIGATDSYDVVDGAIQCKPGHGGNLLTNDAYDNFVVRLEFKLPPGGNNGLAIRAQIARRATWPTTRSRFKCSTIRRRSTKTYTTYQFHGSLYGLAPAVRGYLRPVGEWNYEEVIVDGDNVDGATQRLRNPQRRPRQGSREAARRQRAPRRSPTRAATSASAATTIRWRFGISASSG